MEQATQELEGRPSHWPEARVDPKAVRVVCLADTHGLQGQFRIDVPDGDILVHAGDLTNRGTIQEAVRALAWIASLPHLHKIVVAGNHDLLFEDEPNIARSLMEVAGGITYLLDQEIELEGVRIYGSPWTPKFWGAFNLERGDDLRRVWSGVPDGVDVLVTHGPPMGILDRTLGGEHAGCADLLHRVNRVLPRYHVFGHIHEGRGRHDAGGVTFLNVSVATPFMDRARPAVVIAL